MSTDYCHLRGSPSLHLCVNVSFESLIMKELQSTDSRAVRSLLFLNRLNVCECHIVHTAVIFRTWKLLKDVRVSLIRLATVYRIRFCPPVPLRDPAITKLQLKVCFRTDLGECFSHVVRQDLHSFASANTGSNCEECCYISENVLSSQVRSWPYKCICTCFQ